MRKCTKCRKVLGLDKFHKEKRTKIGLQSRCIKCINAYAKKSWYRDHKKNLERKRLYRLKNRKNLNKWARHRYWNNVEEMRKSNCVYQKVYYRKNTERLKEKSRIYAKKNRHKILITERRWAKKNPAKYKAKNRRHNIKRKVLIKNDGRARLSTRMSNMIRLRLRARLANKNHRHRNDYLPYNIDELVMHLEKGFTKGMTWDNYGKWHLDHIIPDSSFNYTSVEDKEFQKCWALKNLQPLWASDNRSKGNRISPKHHQ